MIKDLKSHEIISSPLNKKMTKHFNGDFSFVSLFGNFFITADRFLPICADNFCTSTDLFGFYEKSKYHHLLNENFYNCLIKESNICEIKDAMIIGSTGNYFHDLIDCYSRLFSFNQGFSLYKNIEKIIVSDITFDNILSEILFKLGINLPIIKLKKNKIYKFKRSIITANRNFKKIIELYKKNFCFNEHQTKSNLFISRKDSFTRTILNEDKVVNILKEMNFKIHTLTNKTLAEQINLFSSSKFIIAMHGAALTNILFAKPNSSIIEITSNFKGNGKDWLAEKNSLAYNDYTRSMYNKLARECGVNHYFYFANSYFSNNKQLKYEFERFTHSNLKVDLDYFKNKIESIIM